MKLKNMSKAIPLGIDIELRKVEKRDLENHIDASWLSYSEICNRCNINFEVKFKGQLLNVVQLEKYKDNDIVSIFVKDYDLVIVIVW